jgi:membrane-bound lytic murein transglycosylase B
MPRRFLLLALVVGVLFPTASMAAVPCGTGGFEAWLADFKAEAAAKGISQPTIAAGLNGLTMDRGILGRDHSQQVFSQTFEEFSGRMVAARRTPRANKL